MTKGRLPEPPRVVNHPGGVMGRQSGRAAGKGRDPPSGSGREGRRGGPIRVTPLEAALRGTQEAKLAPLSARIVANDAVYRAALKVKRIADAVGAADTDVTEAFAGVNERFRRIPAPKEPPAQG
jgi:hypothetical protein